jgi:hypothetical protein
MAAVAVVVKTTEHSVVLAAQAAQAEAVLAVEVVLQLFYQLTVQPTVAVVVVVVVKVAKMVLTLGPES